MLLKELLEKLNNNSINSLIIHKADLSKKIKNSNLSVNVYRVEALKDIAIALKNNHSLEELTIRNFDDLFEGLTFLLQSLKDYSALTHLNFLDCSLENIFLIAALSEVIKANNNLANISFNHCLLSSEAIENISTAIKNNLNIIKLDIVTDFENKLDLSFKVEGVKAIIRNQLILDKIVDFIEDEFDSYKEIKVDFSNCFILKLLSLLNLNNLALKLTENEPENSEMLITKVTNFIKEQSPAIDKLCHKQYGSTASKEEMNDMTIEDIMHHASLLDDYQSLLKNLKLNEYGIDNLD